MSLDKYGYGFEGYEDCKLCWGSGVYATRVRLKYGTLTTYGPCGECAARRSAERAERRRAAHEDTKERSGG